MGKMFTKEEFMAKLFENNKYVRNGSIEVYGEYNGLEKKIEYICHECNTVHSPVAASLLQGHGCSICGATQSHNSRRKSNLKFQEELSQLRAQGRDVYSDEKYINSQTKIWFYCSKGHKWQARPNDILIKGNGCPYCSNRKVLQGFNDIATTSPDIFKFLENPKDGYKYTRWSNKRVEFKCPLCGLTQNRKIASVAHRGFKCEHCGNGISYPNKFGRAFFDQLPIDKYKAEYYPIWGRPYIYDIYFKLHGKEYIVEWDGRQHYEGQDGFGISFSEYQTIDQTKDRLARENGVCLIRVDCRKSECDYIKNNIEKSELNSLFDLSKINWKLCEERAQKNLVKMVCDLWMSGIKSFTELSAMLHLGNSTVRDYINRGVRLGWCDYDSKQWISTQCRHVSVVNTSNGQEYFFNSLKECANATINICGHRIAEETIRKYSKNGVPYNGLLFNVEPKTIQN